MICIVKSGLFVVILRGSSNHKWGILLNVPYNWEGPWKPVWLQNNNFESLHLHIISYIVFYKNMHSITTSVCFQVLEILTWRKNFWLCFWKKILLSNKALKKDLLDWVTSWKSMLVPRSVLPFQNYISVVCSILVG